MEPVIKGIITGLILSIYVGATFFMLVETSITRGFKAALLFDAGIFLSDLFCVTIVYFFAAEILNSIVQNIFIGLFGGVAFIGFGVNYLIGKQNQQSHHLTANRMFKLLMSGFFINILNPSVFVFWLGTLAVSVSHFQFKGKEIFFYLGATLLTVVIIDVLKIYFACWLRKILNRRVIRIIYLCSGIILIVFGIVVIISKIKGV